MIGAEAKEVDAYGPGFHSSYLPLWSESEQVLDHLVNQSRLLLTQILDLLGGGVHLELI